MTQPSPSSVEHILRAIWLEAHETIPPDGKDAAFAALGRIMKLASEGLNAPSAREMSPENVERVARALAYQDMSAKRARGVTAESPLHWRLFEADARAALSAIQGASS